MLEVAKCNNLMRRNRTTEQGRNKKHRNPIKNTLKIQKLGAGFYLLERNKDLIFQFLSKLISAISNCLTT